MKLSGIETTSVFSLSSLHDPKFKTLGFQSPANAERIRESVFCLLVVEVDPVQGFFWLHESRLLFCCLVGTKTCSHTGLCGLVGMSLHCCRGGQPRPVRAQIQPHFPLHDTIGIKFNCKFSIKKYDLGGKSKHVSKQKTKCQQAPLPESRGGERLA